MSLPPRAHDPGRTAGPKQEVRRLIGEHRWERSGLPAPEAWPASLRALVDAMLGSSQPMFVVWGEGRTLIYNDAYAGILQAKHPAAIGQDVLVVWDEIRPDLVNLIEDAYRGQPVQASIKHVLTRDMGAIEDAWFSVSFSPVRDDSGRVAGVFCACMELIDQIAAERRAQAERRRLLDMLRQMPGFACLLVGPEHRYEYVNDAYLQVAGRRDYLGRSVRQVFPEMAGQGIFELLDRVFATGQPYVTRAQPIRFAEERGERRLDFIYQPIREEGGAVVGIFVGGHDVSEQVAAQEQLRRERDKLTAVLDGMGEGYALMDQQFRIVALNAEALRLDGRPAGDLLGRTHWEAYPGSEANEAGRLYKRAMAERVPVALEHDLPWPDGRRVWLDMRAFPVDDGLAVFYRDVTARREAEERARQASERIELALDAGAISGTWVWDVESDAVVGDARFARTFELDPEQCARGIPLTQVASSIHPGDWAKVQEAVTEALARGGAYRCEYRVRDGEGHRWIEANGRVEMGEEGRPARFPGVLIDIHERKLAEDERDRAAALLRTFMEAVPGVVYAKDRHGRMLVANRGTSELLGKPPSEFLGKTDAEFLPDQAQAAAIMATDRRIMETGTAEQVDEDVRRSDGTVSIWLSSKAPLLDDAGSVVGLIGSSVDVTERRVAEKRRIALADFSDRLREMENPNDLADAAAHVLGSTLDASRAGYAHVDATFVEIRHDWTSDGTPELRGRHDLSDFGSFVDDLRRGRPVQIDDAREDERTTASLATLERLRARAILNLPIIEQGRMVALVYVNDGRPRRWSDEEVAFVREIAERTRIAVQRRRAEADLRTLAASLELQVEERAEELRRTEEALRQSQKMEAIGQLTGGIAHDFNNMLAVVVGSLDLLGRRISGADPKARRYLDAASEGARRAAQMTQRLLAFARQQPLNPEPLDINKVVSATTELLRHALGADVRLETSPAPGLWRVHADPHQLENVILNLAVNARDAMPDGGRLSIATENVPEAGPNPGQVAILVRDTGCGMPPEVLARAFDPFYTTKEVGRGTGLGLSQVYGFVRQSGGDVTIQSAPGEGTCVRVLLPRHLVDVEAEPANRPDDMAPRPPTQELVLVVDDERAVRQFSVDALIELGYRVLEAADARGALDLLGSHPEVGLLFTDMVMPDMHGRRLAAAARELRPDLPVLFTTGYPRDALAEPGTEVVNKPFTIEELAAKVRDVLDGSKARDLG